MSVIRVGSTNRYAEGWDAVFGGSRGSRPAAKKAAAKKAPAAQAVKKASAKPAAKAKATAKKAKKATRRRG